MNQAVDDIAEHLVGLDLEVLSLAAQGLRTADIARRTSISSNKVTSRLRHIRAVTGSRNTIQAAAIAARLGLLASPEPTREENDQ